MGCDLAQIFVDLNVCVSGEGNFKDVELFLCWKKKEEILLYKI